MYAAVLSHRIAKGGPTSATIVSKVRHEEHLWDAATCHLQRHHMVEVVWLEQHCLVAFTKLVSVMCLS